MQCECGHWHGSNVAETVKCKCGRELQLFPESGRVVSRNRERFSRVFDQCVSNECGQWGTDASGRRGCLELPIPCHITTHLLAGGACLRDPPMFPHGELTKGAHVRMDSIRHVDTGADVDLITTHFNPCGYTNLKDTYYQWLPTLGGLAGNLHCQELVFEGERPEIEHGDAVYAPRQTATLFQKESLINRAIRRSKAKYVAWLDHDIVIASPNWVSLAIQKIRAGAIAVQCYSRLSFLNHQGKVVESKLSAAKDKRGCPGGAWLAEREFLDDIGGLFHGSPVGGDDQVFFSGVSSSPATFLNRYSEDHQSCAKDWIQRVRNRCGARPVSFVESDAFHLYHGKRANRQYHTRERTLVEHDYNPKTDIRVSKDGYLEWASDKPNLHRDVAGYFSKRSEDDEK